MSNSTHATVTLRASARYGYGGKQYIAQITGRAAKVTFARQFVGTRYGKRNEDSEHETDEVGLYEVCHVDKRGDKDQRYRLVLPAVDVSAHEDVAGDLEQEGRLDVGAALRAAATGLMMVVRVDRAEAMALAKRLDQGDRLEEIVRVVDLENDEIEILTAAQARKAKAAASVEDAVSACLGVLGALPAGEAKKVLTEVRKRLTAPKAEEAL